MKSPLLASLLLMHFHLDSAPDKQKNLSKRQRSTSITATAPVMTKDTIKPLLASDLAFLMIGADFCGHCKTMKPIFDRSFQTEKGIAYGHLPLGDSFYETNEVVKAIEKRYDLCIDAVPMILVFKKNKLVEYKKGAQTKEQLAALVKKYRTDLLATPDTLSKKTLKKKSH